MSTGAPMLRQIVGLALASTAVSCAHYVEKPLTSEVIAERLHGEPLARLTAKAAQLRLPGAPSTVEIAADGTLDALGAAVLAVVAQPNLRASRTRAGIAQAQLTAAGILPNPTLSASLDLPILGDTSAVTAFGLGLSWEITALLTRPHNRQAAQAQLQAVDLEIAWEEWQTAMAAQLSATRLAWLQLRVTTAEADVQLALDFAARLNAALEKHVATTIDADAASAAAENSIQRLVTLQGQLAAEKLQLKRAIGLDPDVQLIVTEPTLLTPTRLPDLQTLQELMPSRRLDLQGLERAYASQDIRVRAAVLSQFPRLALGLNLTRDNANVASLGPGVALDLPIFDRGQGRIALETATREHLFEVYLARRAEARADLAKAGADLAATQTQLRQAGKVVERLQKLAAALTLALQHGQADAVTVFAVRLQLMDARQNQMALAQLQSELHVALQAVVGQLLQEER